MKVSVNINKYRRYRNNLESAGLFVQILGFGGGGGPIQESGGVGVGLGRLWGEINPVWVIILLPHHME
jgi:hypothetical protein